MLDKKFSSFRISCFVSSWGEIKCFHKTQVRYLYRNVQIRNTSLKNIKYKCRFPFQTILYESTCSEPIYFTYLSVTCWFSVVYLFVMYYFL